MHALAAKTVTGSVLCIWENMCFESSSFNLSMKMAKIGSLKKFFWYHIIIVLVLTIDIILYMHSTYIISMVLTSSNLNLISLCPYLFFPVRLLCNILVCDVYYSRKHLLSIKSGKLVLIWGEPERALNTRVTYIIIANSLYLCMYVAIHRPLVHGTLHHLPLLGSIWPESLIHRELEPWHVDHKRDCSESRSQLSQNPWHGIHAVHDKSISAYM